MARDYLFIVKTRENIDEIPQGSGIYVTKESKNNYKGIWASQFGTFNVKIPKDKCFRLEEKLNSIGGVK
ncbi:MAG: hypothetical protein Q7S33_00650 [Nanoarchaeota archaeon]|nr:hypothetical protein [Nanoarchaeota archaeon]